MGEVVGAGLLAHVPTIVLPEATRRELNHGQDSTLVSGLHQLRREVFDVLDYDTVVVLDSHWATTVEWVVTAQSRRQGLFTSEELLDLEHARLALRRTHGMAVDRGRLVREALSIVLADLEENGAASDLVRRLSGA